MSPPMEQEHRARCIYNTALKGVRPPINHTVSLTGIKIAPWHPAHAYAWNSAGLAKPSAPGPTLWSSGRSFPPSSLRWAPGSLPALVSHRRMPQVEVCLVGPEALPTRPRLLILQAGSGQPWRRTAHVLGQVKMGTESEPGSG